MRKLSSAFMVLIFSLEIVLPISAFGDNIEIPKPSKYTDTMEAVGQNPDEANLNGDASRKANLAEQFAREYWTRKKKKDKSISEGSGNELPSSQVLDNGKQIDFEYAKNEAGDIVSVKARIDDRTEMQLNTDGSVTISRESAEIPELIEAVTALSQQTSGTDVNGDGTIDANDDLNCDGMIDASDLNISRAAITADLLNGLPSADNTFTSADNLTTNRGLNFNDTKSNDRALNIDDGLIGQKEKNLTGKEPVIFVNLDDIPDINGKKGTPAAPKPSYINPDRVREFISGFKDEGSAKNLENISNLFNDLEKDKDLVSGIREEYGKLLSKMKGAIKASLSLPNNGNDIALVESIMYSAKNDGENPFISEEQRNEMVRAYDQVREDVDPKLAKIGAQLRSFYGNLSILCKNFTSANSVIYMKYTDDNSLKLIINLKKAKQIAATPDSVKNDKIPMAYAETAGK